MNDKRVWARAILAAASLMAISGAVVAAPSRALHASVSAPGETRAVQDLARSILAGMPAAARSGGCAPPTLDTARAAVSAAIDKVNPSREVALAALTLARTQTPPGAACVLGALDDTSDELDGSGQTIDDAGKTRGFVLYEGPLPATALRRVSNP
jgi:hypothetical protein